MAGFWEIRLLTMKGAEMYYTCPPMAMQIVSGEPEHAEDNMRVWCSDEPTLEDFSMTLEGGNLQGDSQVDNQALEEE